MTREQLNLNVESVRMTSDVKSGGHYKDLMKLGTVIPGTKKQASFFISEKCKFDVLADKDIAIIDMIFADAELQGNYAKTKSNRWARLKNIEDFYVALKKKYNL